MYTSGTAGDPKGVVLLHETVAMTVRGLDIFLEQIEDKVLTKKLVSHYQKKKIRHKNKNKKIK